MKETANIPNAILILGSLYFLVREGFNFWIFLLILFAVATWGYYNYPKENKELVKKKIEEIHSRIMNINTHSELLRSQTLFNVAQVKRMNPQK